MRSDLAQSDAYVLQLMPKHPMTSEPLNLTAESRKSRLSLQGETASEHFFVDVNRGSIEIWRINQTHVARKMYVLCRLDLNGPPHTNPDGTLVSCPHFHTYREGYADKWAEPVPPAIPIQGRTLREIVTDFLRLCNVDPLPQIVGDITTDSPMLQL